MRRLLTVVGVCAMSGAVLGGCAGERRTGVPASLADAVMIDGIANVRFWGDIEDPAMIRRYVISLEREMRAAGVSSVDQLPDAHMLAISGGGEDGAYGAGVLCGWTERGDRPRFKIVTGISTGALIAPFAFVGPDYDHVLREVYTMVTTREIMRSRTLLAAYTSDAAFDSAPLRDLLVRYVDEPFVERVAEAARAGRLLLIGTTNMDAQRPVMWSMGAIATSGHPRRVELFRDVMLASASIPGLFPPVLVEVVGPGNVRYAEMHADGGATSQIFLYPAAFSFNHLPAPGATARRRHAYVIRNAKLTPEYVQVERRTIPIAQRAVSTLIKSHGVGDLYRIYLGCQRDSIDYNLASIPESFGGVAASMFDPVYMRALFEVGYTRARSGYPWAKAPPGFEPPGSAVAGQ